MAGERFLKSSSLVARVFVYYLFIVLQSSTFVHTHVHDCTTPNSTVGSCLPLEQCPQLQELFDKVTTENYEFLRLSQCGYNGSSPEVCCPTSQKKRKFELKEMPPRVPTVSLETRFGSSKASKELPAPGVCGIQNFDNRIYGGIITAIDEFPWMALLSYGKSGVEFACGGALIHSRYVLTAAHCVTGPVVAERGGLQRVRLGEHNIENEIDCDPSVPDDCAPPPVDVKIVRKVIHPEYRPSIPDQHHDIALLELEHDVEINDFVRPVCLVKNVMPALFVEGKNHYVCGWGLTENGTKSPIKLKTKLTIAEPRTCASTYQSRFKIHLGSNQVCVGGSGKIDSCRGDSGGPLMVPATIPREGPVWFMTGLVSIGPTPCATKHIPGIYTRVSNYYDWIVSEMK